MISVKLPGGDGSFPAKLSGFSFESLYETGLYNQ